MAWCNNRGEDQDGDVQETGGEDLQFGGQRRRRHQGGERVATVHNSFSKRSFKIVFNRVQSYSNVFDNPTGVRLQTCVITQPGFVYRLRQGGENVADVPATVRTRILIRWDH